MTTLTITDITNTTKQSKEWSRLHKLWDDIEKKQARNERYEKKLDKFLAEFKQQAETSEQRICSATANFIRHLLTFVPRKTIKGRQREALYEWIEGELISLESNPFCHINTTELREDFTQALIDAVPEENKQLDFEPHELENARQELKNMIGDDLELSDEVLTDILRDPMKLKTFLDDYMAQHAHTFEDEEDEETEWDEFAGSHFEDDFKFHNQPQSSQKSLAFFQTKEITKLYRQLAKQLHPDKELDQEQKEYKKQLMQQLSSAKKERDTFSMLMLAQEHLPDFELNLDKQSLAGLEETLKDKIAQLDHAYQQLQVGSELKSIVWHRFGGGNKRSREKIIQQHVLNLNNEAQEIEEDIAELKTVKDMQVALRERVNHNAMLDAFDDLLINKMFMDNEYYDL